MERSQDPDGFPGRSRPSGGQRGPQPSIGKLLIPMVTLGIGLLVSAWPTLSSGFADVQGGLGDTRLVNFTLEHSYRWLRGLPLATDFWSPPMFFPTTGVAAYTDLLLGVAPLYWMWRWLGALPDTAYQLWMLTCWALNFAAFYLLLRRRLETSIVGSSAGAWLFAFSSPRMASIMHQQLVVQVFIVVALSAVIEVVKDTTPRPGTARLRIWIAVFFAATVLQLYTAVYPLLYLGLGLAAAAVAAACTASGRQTMIRIARTYPVTIVAGAAVAMLAAAPVLTRYGAFGPRALPPNHLPRLASWFLMGENNAVWGWLHHLPRFEWAHRSLHHNGIGILAMALCCVGLWRARHIAIVRLMVIAVVSLFVITLRFPGGWNLWEPLCHAIPGGTSARAIARVGMTLLYPAAFGFALAVDTTMARRRWRSAAILLLLVLIEQIHLPMVYDKIEARNRIAAIGAAIPRDAEAFLLVTTNGSHDQFVHEDAMWAAFEADVPTINGRYGRKPGECWQLRNVHAGNRKQTARVRSRLETWIECQNLDESAISWVEFQARPNVVKKTGR